MKPSVIASTIEDAVKQAQAQNIKFDYISLEKGNDQTHHFFIHRADGQCYEAGFWVKDAKIAIFHTLPRQITLKEYRNFARMGNLTNPTGTFNTNLKVSNQPRFQ